MGLDIKDEKTRRLLIATAISIAAIVVILKITGTNITWRAIFQADLRLIVLAFFLHVLSWVFWAVRLQYLTTLIESKITFNLAIRATLASNFMAALTPSSAGGEPLRIWMLMSENMTAGSATAVALAERLLDSLFFITALVIFLFLSNLPLGLGLEIGAVFLVMLILLLVFLWELVKRPHRIERLLNWTRKKFGDRKILFVIEREIWLFRDAGIKLARATRTQIPTVTILTTLIWICEFLIPSVILLGLGASPNYINSITAQLIIVIIALLPLTPGSSGIAELSMSYFYSSFVPGPVLGVLVGLWRLITYFSNIIVGVAFAGASIQGWLSRKPKK